VPINNYQVLAQHYTIMGVAGGALEPRSSKYFP